MRPEVATIKGMSAAAPSHWLRDGPGAVLRIFREHGRPLTKSEVVALSGLSRSAITQRIELLVAADLLRPARAAATGGRPAEGYELNVAMGVLLIADMGATKMRVAVCDIVANILAEETRDLDVTDGPEAVLSLVTAAFGKLLAEAGHAAADVRGIGIDIPGPVDHALGRAVHPPIMPGWHDFDVPSWFQRGYDCPVLVEKDVNAMAFGEQRLNHSATDDLVYVKLGTGIGTGLVLQGEIYRGADGAAGDMGHIPLTDKVDDPSAPMCRCGNRGCIEAYASGWAIQRDLEQLGYDVSSVHDVVSLIAARNEDALDLIRRATHIVGTALSDLVNIVNPRRIVIGGQLAAVEEYLISGIRSVVYRRSLPLATRRLEVLIGDLGNRAGVYGLARLVADEVLSIERVDGSTRPDPAR